jgi:hypothetical protein
VRVVDLVTDSAVDIAISAVGNIAPSIRLEAKVASATMSYWFLLLHGFCNDDVFEIAK